MSRDAHFLCLLACSFRKSGASFDCTTAWCRASALWPSNAEFRPYALWASLYWSKLRILNRAALRFLYWAGALPSLTSFNEATVSGLFWKWSLMWFAGLLTRYLYLSGRSRSRESSWGARPSRLLYDEGTWAGASCALSAGGPSRISLTSFAALGGRASLRGKAPILWFRLSVASLTSNSFFRSYSVAATCYFIISDADDLTLKALVNSFYLIIILSLAIWLPKDPLVIGTGIRPRDAESLIRFDYRREVLSIGYYYIIYLDGIIYFRLLRLKN